MRGPAGERDSDRFIVRGECCASASPAATATPAPISHPRVVATVAFEALLTIVYDRPMKHMLGCGTKGMGAGLVGTIDGFETNISSRYYTSTDPDFDEMLGTTWEAWLNGDCTAVTFSFVHGIGPGRYPLKVARVQDLGGNTLDPDPMVVTVIVVESAPPRMTLVQSSGAEVWIKLQRVDQTRPRERRLPLSTRRETTTCGLERYLSGPHMREVVLTLPAAPARIPETVTAAGLEDMLGNPFWPGTETQPILLMQGQSR